MASTLEIAALNASCAVGISPELASASIAKSRSLRSSERTFSFENIINFTIQHKRTEMELNNA